jgi:hypothetical protein
MKMAVIAMLAALVMAASAFSGCVYDYSRYAGLWATESGVTLRITKVQDNLWSLVHQEGSEMESEKFASEKDGKLFVLGTSDVLEVNDDKLEWMIEEVGPIDYVRQQ